MPPALHPYLKRGLALNASPIAPSDRVEDVPTEHPDAQDGLAKRRRVEAIALQYLRGRAPLILTAHLRGPFNSGEWQNPWSGTQREGLRESRKGVARHAREQRKTRSKAPPVPSPEASRAVRHAEEQRYSQSDLELLPATAPMPDDDDHSGGTEFFSVDTEQFVANNTPTNPFWLRRPATTISFPANSQTDRSPSRIRKRDHRYSSRESLQPAPSKKTIGGRRLPLHKTPADEWRSSASASMDISPLAQSATANKHQALEQHSPHASTATNAPESPRLREDSAQEEEARSSQAAQYAQTEAAVETPTAFCKNPPATSPQAQAPQLPYAQSFDSLVPATTYKAPCIVQVPRSSPVQKQRHDLVASPAPDSSTGFMYRRTGQPKNGTSVGQKLKPRAVSFSSSSPAKNGDKHNPAAGPEPTSRIVATEVLEDSPFTVIAGATGEDGEDMVDQNEGMTETQEAEQQKEDQHESYRSRQSQYSTQAAMLLAQLEFQEESSQSSISSLTLRPWSQPAQNTPPALMPQPSPALTPLSVFNPHAELSFSGLAGDSALDGPPVSTQDLFNAASPFAFSTVKKKNQRSRRASMRFALTKLNDGMTVVSPTPLAEREPLQDKNIRTMQSVPQEKSCINPSMHASQSPRRTTVELPQLDFHTSLDFGPNADFTDYFLKGLDNEP